MSRGKPRIGIAIGGIHEFFNTIHVVVKLRIAERFDFGPCSYAGTSLRRNIIDYKRKYYLHDA